MYECDPKTAPDGRFRKSIHMGQIESTRISTAALDRIRPDFPGDSYNVIFKNCNDFSTAFVRAMMNKEIPGHINRLARLGRSWPIRCFLPPNLKGNAASSTTAPLLAAEPQVQLFQGAGQSLRGTSESSLSTSGARSALKCIGSRFQTMFSQGYTPTSDNSASNTALIQSDSNARELRAAAAARRLSGDLEAGEGSGQIVTPMPNPWQ